MAIQIVGKQGEREFLASASTHARYTRARLMVKRGRGFIEAAMLLDKKDRHSEVVLHLLCQGVEVLVKGLLLVRDYNKHEPLLVKSYGHDLVKVVGVALAEYRLQPLRPAVAAELAKLSSLYKQHLLRYSSLLDLLGGLAKVETGLVTRRLFATMRLSARKLRI